MRIEAYTQIQQVYNTKKTARTEAAKKPSFADAVQISSVGRDIQVAKQAVSNTPDVREELVSSLKARIDAGTYSVSAEQLADKLLSQPAVSF